MEIIFAILGGAAGAAVINGVFSLIKLALERKFKKEDSAESRQAVDCRQQQKKLDDVIVAIRQLLYDRLKHLGKKYIEQGYITSEELEDFLAMHSVYHNEMKGNGFLDELVEQVKHLPIRG